MSTKRIDGTLFEKLIHGGLYSLTRAERELNSLNVFPVPDGDTGTNMRLTLENGIRCAQPTKALNEYLKALSSGMLLGARGNSGVILSQLLKGIYLELSRCSAANAVELRNAFIRGYKAAYESVIKPVEGTILTVAREGIELVSQQQRRITDIEDLLSTYLANMEVSLSATPRLLPVLAEMGVVDSGGKGYIAIISGMLEALTGSLPQTLPAPERPAGAPMGMAAPSAPAPDLSKFTEDSDFNEGYCTEFILQLMKKPGYDQDFSSEALLGVLQEYGDSLVVVRDGMRVKVHVHTKTPAPIIEYAQRYGEFLTFKLENMQLQHNEFIEQRNAEKQQAEEEAERLPMAVIAVANGEGIKRLFRDLGCACVIEGGPTMNASSQDFLSAIKSVNASEKVILPNGPNMMLAAQQAVELSGEKNVRVLASKSPAEGYFALAMDVPDSEDVAKRVNQLLLGISSTETMLVAPAARDFTGKGVSCHENEYIALMGDELVYTSPDPIETVVNGLKTIPDIEDREVLLLFRGAKTDASAEEQLRAALSREFPLHELDFEWGGQDIYDWIIGVS